MKTVYFPYTAIESRKAEALAAVWGPLTLVQPSPEACLPETRSLQKAGWIETLCPATDHTHSLMDLMQALEQWAAQNTGSDLAALVERGQAIPFFSSQSSTQIAAQLRQRGGSPGQDAPAGEPRQTLLQDQLLLAMAQKFDCQQEELARAIDALAQKERHMMALLKGEVAPARVTPTASRWASTARRDAMLDRRLKAWARVMTALRERETRSPEAEDPILFLTDNPGVAAQIVERLPEARTRLEGYAIASGTLPTGMAARLPSWLAEPLTFSAGATPGRTPQFSASIDLIEIPAVSVDGFLRRLSGDRPREVAEPTPRSFSGSCWVGAITWPEDASGPIE